MSDLILGIDPGTRYCGYSLLRKSNDKCILEDFGLINLTSEKSIYDRMRKISIEVCDILDRCSPNILVIEDVYYQKNFKSTSKMLQFKGVIILRCLERDLRIVEYAPSHVKKVVTGDGKAGKMKIMYSIKNFFGLDKDLPRDDVSDAIAVGLCYFKNCINGGSIDGDKRQVVKKRKKGKRNNKSGRLF